MHAIPHKYSKIYLSVSETRRRSIDEPVGDPYGGPAYGERRMPVAAIAVFAYGASIVATEVVIGGLLMASGALSFVGSVTGNKTLSMLGAVAGLGAGAVGGFEALTSEGVSGMTGEQLSATTSDSLTGAVASGNVAGMEAAGMPSYAIPSYESATVGAQGALSEAGMIPSAVSNAMTAANTGLANGVDASFNSILGTDGSALNIGGTGPVSTNAPVAGVDAAAPGQAATPGSAPSVSAPEASAPNVAGGNTVSPNTPVVDAPKAGLNDMNGIDAQELNPARAAQGPQEKGLLDTAMEKLNGVGKFAKENKELLDYGGNILKAYGESDLKDAQQKYMEAKANNDDAQAEYYRAKIAEMNRLAANANARGANALSSGNAISSNGSAYSNNPTRAGNVLSFGKA